MKRLTTITIIIVSLLVSSCLTPQIVIPSEIPTIISTDTFTPTQTNTPTLTPTPTERIAFVSDRDGNQEIYLMELVGSAVVSLTNLTNNPADDYEPVWSPDGTRIAFVSNRDDPDPASCEPGCDTEIYVMELIGDTVVSLTNLTNKPYHYHEPVWSLDGSRIVFISMANYQGAIYVINSDGSNYEKLTNAVPTRTDWQADWSPDGNRILFASNRDDYVMDIYVVDSDGSNEIRLTYNLLAGNPKWSPDSNRIIFTRTIPGEPVTPVIYVMNSDGSNQTYLADGYTPTWSPDSIHIAFMSLLDGEIYVMNVDGTGVIRLTHDSSGGMNPVWSPDGNRIAFSNNNVEIYMVNADGSNQVNLTNNPANDWGVVWAPVP